MRRALIIVGALGLGACWEFPESRLYPADDLAPPPAEAGPDLPPQPDMEPDQPQPLDMEPDQPQPPDMEPDQPLPPDMALALDQLRAS